jgi:hypothetical protein
MRQRLRFVDTSYSFDVQGIMASHRGGSWATGATDTPPRRIRLNGSAESPRADSLRPTSLLPRKEIR